MLLVMLLVMAGVTAIMCVELRAASKLCAMAFLFASWVALVFWVSTCAQMWACR